MEYIAQFHADQSSTSDSSVQYKKQCTHHACRGAFYLKTDRCMISTIAADRRRVAFSSRLWSSKSTTFLQILLVVIFRHPKCSGWFQFHHNLLSISATGIRPRVQLGLDFGQGFLSFLSLFLIMVVNSATILSASVVTLSVAGSRICPLKEDI